MAKSLDIDVTTITVASRALAQFREEYPNRIPVWVNSEADQLDIKIGSICKEFNNDIKEAQMRHHVWFHETTGIIEV
jgi:ribose 1,5-bisphosphokinase PhnN|tara:strand:- start:765 stop:995 length:231 start_codon:yes stop_codon:yes gene_type:complete